MRAAICPSPPRSPATPPAPSSICTPSPRTPATSTARIAAARFLTPRLGPGIADHAVRNRTGRLHLFLRLRHHRARPAVRLARHRRAGVSRHRRRHRRIHGARFRQPGGRFPPHPRPARPNAPAARSAPLVAHRYLLPVEIRHGLVGSLRGHRRHPLHRTLRARARSLPAHATPISSPAIPSARR